MAAPVRPTKRNLLIDSETAIKKGFSVPVGRIHIIAKILFRAKQILKIARDFEPALGEPRRARRATKSMGGALRRPKNGFRKIGTSGSGVFIQLRSNLFYQKILNFTSAPTAAGGGQKKPIGSRAKNFLP